MINASKLDLTRATTQDVFDYVVFALIQQGKPARDRGACQYRAPDGCRCAAGHLIADDEYTPKLEGRVIGNAITGRDGVGDDVGPALLPSLDRWIKGTSEERGSAERLSFLHDIQAAHDQRDLESDKVDSAEWLAVFRARAFVVAKTYRLDGSILNYRAPASLTPFAVQAGRSIFGANGIGTDDEILRTPPYLGSPL